MMEVGFSSCTAACPFVLLSSFEFSSVLVFFASLDAAALSSSDGRWKLINKKVNYVALSIRIPNCTHYKYRTVYANDIYKSARCTFRSVEVRQTSNW